MNKLKEYRVQQNLTQEELSEKSGLSVRTIQRIEAGGLLKGHSLKSLANALGLGEEELLGIQKPSEDINYSMVKLINLSALPFTLIPILNVIVPLLIMLISKKYYLINKQIISVQIMWTVLTLVIFLTSVILRNTYYLSDSIPVMVLGTLMTINAFIILRNAAEIDRKQQLYIKLNFNVI